MSTEPETWLGNVWAAGLRGGPPRDCDCRLCTPEVPPRTACLGCGLPLPHAAGECKREAK
jgi:hypothetical protein